MNRRELLAACGGLAASSMAGCSGVAHESSGVAAVGHEPTASLRMNPISDGEIAKRATYSRDIEQNDSDYALIESVVDDGTATKRGTEPPFRHDLPVVYDDSVYEISYDVTGSQPATSFQFKLDFVDGDGNVSADDTVAYDDLPEVDQRKLTFLGFPDDGVLGIGSSFVYPDSEIHDSALVPEPTHSVIVFDDGTRGRFSVDGSYDTSVKTYEYTSKLVDESAAAFGANVRDECEFVLSGLSDDEAKIVSKAIRNGNGYVVPREQSLPDAMAKLAERFEGQTRLTDVLRDRTISSGGALIGEYVVRYDGKSYLTRLNVTGGQWSFNTSDSKAV